MAFNFSNFGVFVTEIQLTEAEYEALPRRYVFRKTYVPYDVAKMLMATEAPHITTVGQYRRWHKENKIAYLPQHPQRVYSDFSWSDFLDTDVMPYQAYLAEKRRLGAIEYRPLWEAIRWAQQYCRTNDILTRKQWEKHYSSATDIPENIPKYPHKVYQKDDYPGFRVWCGRDATGLMESSAKVTPVVALVHIIGQPANVVKWISCNDRSELVELWHKQDTYDRLLGCWQMESDTKSHISNIQANIGVTGDDYLTVANMQQFLWELNTTLLIVRV